MRLNLRQHRLLTQQLPQSTTIGFKEASSANIESTNKPLSLESNNVSHNDQATPSSETTSHLNVETSTTQNTTSEKHNNSSQGSAFSQEKATLEPTTNENNTSSQEKAKPEPASNENNTSQSHDTKVKPSPSTSDQKQVYASRNYKRIYFH